MYATRAAVEEGIVSGGGTALLYSISVLEKDILRNEDQKVGFEIVRRTLKAPIRQIVENSGEDGSIVIGKLLDAKDINFGYNAQTNEYGDMFGFGVIDPMKVVRTALQDAASVASLLITTEAMVAEIPDNNKNSNAPAPDMGGMGGMNNMGGF
jgi:chaperonin GroEL